MNNRGFTLIELMIVISIVGLLIAAFAAPPASEQVSNTDVESPPSTNFSTTK